MTHTRRLRAGIDIGGTFTDFILFDEAQAAIRLHKHLTTAHDPSQGALKGLSELIESASISVADLAEIVHGTTLVTNAVIERKGASVGMITTKGFRDILEIGTEQRYDIYDLALSFPPALVERARRLEVSERIDAAGREILPLDEAAVIAAASALVRQGVEAVAICFMHSYANPDHERRARDLIAREFPDLSISISSEVVAEISEYQRFATTCANAYVQPLMDRYLCRFETELRKLGFDGDFRLMHSAGGLVSLDAARAFPIRLLESGPAGGALATAWFGHNAGHDNVISFDMGGTTAKACLIENGRADIASYLEAGREHRFKNGSGLPIKAPVVDMIEIGAGGGSIASIDAVGLMQVGPHSAGSEPGPACYGRGGEKPTVTDASVALGYYDPDFFLGGRMKLDLQAAERALDGIAKPLGISAAEAAWGVHQVVAESMANAARIHLIEKGKDPRSYSMIGFGGAGPAFAARVARILGVSEVIIPPASGAASAFGFLTAPLSFDFVRSHRVALSPQMDMGEITAICDDLAQDGRAQLRQAGVADDQIIVERMADMRLVGQLHEITVPLPAGELASGSYVAIREAFERVYAARYTSVPNEARLEILSFRCRTSGPAPQLTVRQAGVAGGNGGDGRKGSRRSYFSGEWLEAGIYDRYALVPGQKIQGPAIIEEHEATTIVPPGDNVSVDEVGNLHIAIAAAAKGATVVDETMSLDQAVSRIQSDPIALEVMWSRLVNVAEEMWSTVCRTAFSLIISESQDFGCAILDPNGETLAHSARVMPVFNLTLPMAVKAILKRYPVEAMTPGDVYITNDPWLCAGHLFDLAIVTPVFHRGRVVALMGTVGHVGDIGGSRDGLSVSELYEEGLQIPAMKLVNGGTENEDLFRLMGENIRDSEQVLGDVRSFIAANATGAARMQAFMDEYGMHDLQAFALVVQSLSEKAIRQAIGRLKDGVYHSEISNNPMGSRMTFPLKVTVAGEEIELDFEGAPPQTARGGINCTLSYTTAHATYPLKCMLTPNVRGNAGCYRPFTVKAPKGSILNCDKPAPVSLRTRTGWYLAPNIFRAMADAAPEMVQSFSGLPSLLSFYGKSDEGALFYELLLLGGGQGASAGRDGKSSLLWPTSAATSSIEMLESRSPIVVWEKTLMTDSGGAGEFRGGLSVRVRVSRRNADGQPIRAIVSPEGVDMPVEGLFGGASGLTAHGRMLRLTDGVQTGDCGTGQIVDLEDADTVIELQLAGGSGYGDPRDRDPLRVAEDLRQGYISTDAAGRIYGLSRSGDAPVKTETAG
ncbi:hydantoinase B/oxoprolinase family protein [Paracoccus onubensis]|uniref:hydantoinase B/oxoprolinase family protein n=1 Tax=Paracoccus onubensis TaxID=1675788 RepID=UPI00272F9370|nr:hydantoinase B/oxoprolinase family protein [Paracoccus onubensis]MDP0927983.1 hydantoinase B/oxoprolinase family protein [Paracoccus onubensis]